MYKSQARPAGTDSMSAVAPEDALPDRRSTQALDMEAFVPSAITNLAQRITTTASAAYRPHFGVGITDWRVMALLAAEPWIAPVKICEATGLDKAAVSRSLRDLGQAGLVEARPGEPNQRRLPFALTAEGLRVHDELVTVARGREERLLRGFSAEERRLLADFIARLRREVEGL
jgi:DNA-binding MarR family transcriptional regulator